jgi:hypothetical protein
MIPKTNFPNRELKRRTGSQVSSRAAAAGRLTEHGEEDHVRESFSLRGR